MNNNFSLIPLTQYKIQLQLIRDCKLPYYHGAELYSMLCTLLDRHPIGIDVITYPAESGKVFFRQNELYNFGISFIGNETYNENSLAELFNSAFAKSDGMDITSFFSLKRVEKVNLDVEPPKELNSEIQLRFLTPLRMPRLKKSKGKSFFDPSFFDPGYFLQSLSNRIDDLCTNLNIRSPIDKSLESPKCELIHKNLMWVDVPFSQTIGGITGIIKFSSPLNDYWKWVLWTGQFLHAGRNSSFGFGKYRIENIKNRIFNISRAQSILQSSMECENIAEAFHLLKKNPHHNSVPEGKFETEFENNLDENIENLKNEVLENKYKPDHLKGYFVPKSEGRKRALAVPDFKDRLVQKSVCDIIAPAIECLLEESSFAYRKGLSRISAANAINKAKKEGLRFAVKCDVEAFYDSIDWDILFDKLGLLFYDDPVLQLLKEWIKQPVYFKDKVIIRERGLPQGAVISPVLANLYLDQFDEMIGDDFKLVRYADDFIILCRSKQDAENALKEAEEILGKLHLEINKNKTLITTFDHGFQYLGIMFNKSGEEVSQGQVPAFTKVPTFTKATVGKPAGKQEQGHAQEPVKKSTAFNIPAETFQKNWVMQLDTDAIKHIDIITKGKPVKIDKLNEVKHERKKYPIYVNGYLIKVKYEGDTLVLENEEEGKNTEKRIPFSQIHSVLFVGNPRISFPVVVKLKQNGIPTYFARKNGKLYLTVLVEPRNYNIWLKQLKLCEDEEFKLNFAKTVVSAKIVNSAVTLERFGSKENTDQLKHFTVISSKANDIDMLRGVEGRASAIFFECYGKLIDAEWKFNGRKKHPPPDPVNTMLSIGYMLLLNHISTSLQVIGLNPEIGFYHISRGRYPALASDLIEEFRFITDRLVLYIINRKIIKYSDFTFNDKSKFPCTMNPDARKKLFEQFEMRLNNNFTPEGSEEKTTYFNYIYAKAESVKDMLKENASAYKPLVTR